MTNQKQSLDLDDGRIIQKANHDTVARCLMQSPLHCGETSIGPRVLEAAAEVIRGTDSEYAPVVVDVEKHDGIDGSTTTLAMVNTEEPDDVVVLFPRYPTGGDDL